MAVVPSRLAVLVSLLGLPERLVPRALSLTVPVFSLTRPEAGVRLLPPATVALHADASQRAARIFAVVIS